MSSFLFLLTYLTQHITSINAVRPNIIYMFGDDIGYNDVQFTSNDLSNPSTNTLTPNLNALATEGVILQNYYVHRMCSPTRAAFLSGRYSFRYGMSTALLSPNIKIALTRQVSLLSEELKAAQYHTHAIGKWHLGFQSWEYTPTYRGFDTFYGYYNAFTDYYTSSYDIFVGGTDFTFWDLRWNEKEVSPNNVYSIYRFRDRAIEIIDAECAQLQTESESNPFFLYISWQSSHTPSEAPDSYADLYMGSDDNFGELRVYNQAQTSSMDDAIGAIVDALKSNGIWDNTLLVFSSDNGAAATIGDNFPLRGYKKTTFEGGLRVPCFVSGGYLAHGRRGKVIGGSEYFHVSDWYPTLLEAAKIGKPKFIKSTRKKSVKNDDIYWEQSGYTIPLDGQSLWNRIQYGEVSDTFSHRLMILDTVVDSENDCVNGSIRYGKWKYMKGLGTPDYIDDGDDGYLWGEAFADINTDAHLWGTDFANTDVDNSLGCDLSAQPRNLYCYESVDGCLFNLEIDPCEFNDVSGVAEHAQLFGFLKDKMQNLAEKMPTDFDSTSEFDMEASFDAVDQWLPKENGIDFWTPWQDYEQTEFERMLYSDFERLYGEESSVESLKNMSAMHPTVTVSSSCNDKTDGLYYIKPTVHGSVIAVICSGGYTMLDASLHYESLATYFTSMYQFGDADRTIYGTDCGDSGGWRQWYIPATKNTQFRVARDCLQCQQGEMYGDNTGYYMTNGYFCPVDLDIDGCSDQKDMLGQTIPDVMCNTCDDIEGLCGEGEGRTGHTLFDSSAQPSWCDCFTLQLTADHNTIADHQSYCQQTLNWRPNLVIDRSQCTCYKPLDIELKIYNNIRISELPFVSAQYRQQMMDSGLYIDDLILWDTPTTAQSRKECLSKDKTYLSQSDFESGTYRMTECGNYVLTEDIIINFNAPKHKFSFANGDSPNAYNLEDLPWFPSTAQQESGQYFGLNAFWGPYSIGFMAAITVETNYVWIDLNGFSIAMDYEFYLQQRFFAIIEFGNKQFESRQGPVDFGRDDLCSKDISVKDGTLGLSSHHGIHGSCVKNVQISNLVIKNFDVTGLQCNGCKDMDITDSEIGPQNTDIPVKGRYTHARAMLSRLRYLVDEYGDESMRFANRNGESITVSALADSFVEQMDMVYYHIIDGIEFAESNKQWLTAKQTFLNSEGWMDGGSSYGILLNGFGTAVVNIGRRTGDTYNINIRNVEVHNIKVKPLENFWASSAVYSAIIHGFFFETIDWNNGGVIDDESGLYIGDTYTDLLFAANKFMKSDFCPLGSLFNMDGLGDWAWTDGRSAWDDSIGLEYRCGSDIQSHSAKGAMGIRIDGVTDYTLENILIRDVVNQGSLGSDKCGEYEKITFEYGVDVDKDIQYGYTGNDVHGILTDYCSGSITNVKLEGLKSLYGSAKAIALYKGSQTVLDGYISINQIIAGAHMTDTQVSQLRLPNPKPFVCSILIGPNSESDTNPELSPIVSVHDHTSVMATNLFGFDYCESDARVGPMSEVRTPKLHFNVKVDMSGNAYIFAHFKNSLLLLFLSVLLGIALIWLKSYCYLGNIWKMQSLKKRQITTYGSV